MAKAKGSNRMQRVTEVGIDIEDRPGALYEVLKRLKEAKVSLLGVWGFPTSEGKGRVLLVPKDPAKCRKALEGTYGGFVSRPAYWVTGSDRVGALLETLAPAADAGVNVHALTALATGGKFAGAVFVDDPEPLRRALGLKA